MSKELRIGTLLRLPDMTAEMLAFLKSAGLETTQIARAGDDWMNGAAGVEHSEQSFRLLAEHGLDCVSLFMGMAPGTTGDGFATEECRTSRMLFAARQLLWAKKHGIKYVTCHVGALASIGEGAAYKRLVSDYQQLLRFAEENEQYFLFETGPESVAGLKKIFADIGSPNLGINFDPANFLWYNQDDPSVLVEEMWQSIKVVHCKDAVRPAQDIAYPRVENVRVSVREPAARIVVRADVSSHDGALAADQRIVQVFAVETGVANAH